MATPAMLPTTPPTTTGVDGVFEAFELVPFPVPAVVVGAVPVLAAVPPGIPPPVIVATTEELGE